MRLQMLRLLEYAVFGELSIRQVEIARENLLADDTGSAGAVCFANRFTLQGIVTGSQSEHSSAARHHAYELQME